MKRLVVVWVAASACTGPTTDDDTVQDTEPAWPEPDAWGPTHGPGAPRIAFDEADLFEACAYLQGDPTRSADHHNLVVMYDGYVLMPWAPEDGIKRLDWEACGMDAPPTPEAPGDVADCEGVFGGGITFWDFSDPCAPTKVGEGWTPWMRESHAIGLSTVAGRTYAAVDFLAYDGSGGVGFWDITDVTAPVWVSQVAVPNHHYPDSYTRLTLSTFWQGPYVFASTASNGVFVIDASDPLNPTVADQITFEGIHVAGTFHVWGNTAMSSSAGISRTILMDVSDPLDAQPIFGGTFDTRNSEGRIAPYYFANVGSHWGLYAHSPAGGGGPLVYDLTDPEVPTLVAAATNDRGEGGYIFQHGDFLFEGESTFGTVYDFSDPSAPTAIGEFALQGDLDTVTPLGNVAVLSVDERSNPGQASSVVPWATEPDAIPPHAGMTSPHDGAVNQAVTSRIGVVFDEMVEPVSVFAGSFRVRADDGEHVEGSFNVQENIVNFTPAAPLREGVTYTVTIPSGGIVDLSGNPVDAETTFGFTVAGTRAVDTDAATP
ncbi:MAG: Ig-like domain-containing protein [Alphaproteobacteria bacterium]|nr:Ig-like domain-containing protein [Alphaproteobacteria bacterium]